MNSNTSTAPDKDANFECFYTEVKEIEKRDSVLTPKQQIDRLLRPGSTYLNLNPFEVLQIDPELPIEEIKKKYRRLSILVHPDKNQDDPDRAQQAFEAVNKAWKILENELTRKKCMDVIEEAKGRTDIMLTEKRKKAKKEGKDKIPEDDPDNYKHAIYVLTMKLFADMERKRRDLAERDQEERKRKREAEIEEEEMNKAQKEWQKNFEEHANTSIADEGTGCLDSSVPSSKLVTKVEESNVDVISHTSTDLDEESRQNRVDSWQSFQANTKTKSSKSNKKMKMFRPPKNKPESR